MDIMYDSHNPWANAREKSSAASHREDVATSKFDYVKQQMQMAIIENTKTIIGMGCLPQSTSPFRLLSPELVENIYSYLGYPQPDENVARGRSGLAIVPFEGWRRRRNDPGDQEVGMNLADMTLFAPGSKITIPLTSPAHHLTSPCYRDLRKHIKKCAGWDVKRIAATPEQKKQFKQYRKGKVFFVNVVYEVGPGKKKATKGSKHPRKSPGDPIPEPLSPEQQGEATSALDEAVQSAGINGKIDPVRLQTAIDAGYSKCFLLGKANEYWDSVKDTKPPAAKKAKRKSDH